MTRTDMPEFVLIVAVVTILVVAMFAVVAASL
jgi:hypothetical protein